MQRPYRPSFLDEKSEFFPTPWRVIQDFFMTCRAKLYQA